MLNPFGPTILLRQTEAGHPELDARPRSWLDTAYCTVKVTAVLVPLFAVLTVTFRAFLVAVREMLNVAVTLVSSTTVNLLTVMPPPLTLIPVAPCNPLPLSVTFTDTVELLLRVALAGEILVSVGGTTVNVLTAVVPAEVVTVTLRAVAVAVLETVNVAVTSVELTKVTLLTAIPPPDTLTPKPLAMKFAPFSATVTAVPRRPEVGERDVSVGGTAAVTVKPTV